MSDTVVKYGCSSDGALRQSEVLFNVPKTFVRLDSVATVDTGVASIVDVLIVPYAVIVSQDCDLEQDFRARESSRVSGEILDESKCLIDVLFCEMSAADDLKINSGLWKPIGQNKNERYHFLEAFKGDKTINMPEMVVDFKRYFSIPVPEIYKRIELGQVSRIAFLNSPYLEHLSTRFSYYQSRIALPEDHTSLQ